MMFVRLKFVSGVCLTRSQAFNGLPFYLSLVVFAKQENSMKFSDNRKNGRVFRITFTLFTDHFNVRVSSFKYIVHCKKEKFYFMNTESIL